MGGCGHCSPRTGKKKNFSTNGKVQKAKKGNTEPTAKTAANRFFSSAFIFDSIRPLLLFLRICFRYILS